MPPNTTAQLKIRDFKHQTDANKAGHRKKFFAYFMGPGTGKTRVELLDAWDLYDNGEIDAMIILAPNSVKTSWVMWDHMKDDPSDEDQVTTHLRPILPRILKGLWTSSAHGQDKKCWHEFEDRLVKRQPKFIILAVNYEALLNGQLFEFLSAFCQQYRTLIVADESTRIGKPGAKRTKRALKLARLCKYRRILTGTPIVKSPMKIYTQAKFLDLNALPFNSFYAFRNRYAIMGGFQGRQIIAYQNLDELSNYIERWSYRCRKEDCLDLPPQIYLKRRLEMTPEQMTAYKTMREEFYADIRGEEVTAQIVLAQVTRLQQITGGYLHKDGKVIEIIPPDRNPKLQETLQILEAAEKQCIVWARFRPEIAGMASLLDPKDYFEFHGDVPERDRVSIRKAFKRGERKYLLGTESTGGIGIDEFKVADTVVHISSDFDTEKRIQADDRTHRIGSEMHERVTYYDLVVPNTVDVKVLRVLRTDTQLSAKILREQWREWV